MTDHQIRIKLAPSTRAASSSSRGSVMKYWRRKKIYNGLPPKNAGTVSGKRVLIHPRLRKRINNGIKMTKYGSIKVLSMITNKISRPGKRRRANAKAASEEVSSSPINETSDTIRVFFRKVKVGTAVSA